MSITFANNYFYVKYHAAPQKGIYIIDHCEGWERQIKSVKPLQDRLPKQYAVHITHNQTKNGQKSVAPTTAASNSPNEPLFRPAALL